MSLEDVFIAIVDQSTAKKKSERSRTHASKGRGQIEQDLAKNLVEKATAQQTPEFSSLFGTDDERAKKN